MKEIQFEKDNILGVFILAEKFLLDRKNIVEIKYSNFDYSTFDKYNQSLLKSVSGNPIVYCIWAGSSLSDILPKYIGHAGARISRQRIRNHLTKKHLATGAQLENVRNALGNKNIICISILTIDPPFMRKALEDWLIEKNSGILDWNLIGKKLQ